MRYDEPRLVWSSQLSRTSDGTREEPGTLTQGAPVFPGSSRLGIEPKTPGWLVQESQQDPTTGRADLSQVIMACDRKADRTIVHSVLS